MSDRSAPRLQAISPDATPDEVAAIVAALSAAHRRVAAVASALEEAEAGPGRWVEASRLVARRSGMTRGPWRLAGRLPRRTR